MIGALLSALLLATSLPPWSIAPLVLVAFVPWLRSLRAARGAGAAIARSLVFGTLFTTLAFSWLADGVRAWFEVPGIYGWAALLLYGVVCHLNLVIFALVYRAAYRHAHRPAPWWRPALLAGAFVALELATPRLLPEPAGLAFYWVPWIRQGAELGGVPLLTLFALWVNLAVTDELARPRSRDWRRAGAPALAALALLVFGGIREYGLRRALAETPRSVTAVAIQGGHDRDLKAAALHARGPAFAGMVARYLELSEKSLAARDADFVVWPETAYPAVLRDPANPAEERAASRIRETVRRSGRPFLIGAFETRDLGLHNSLVALPDQARAPASAYDKAILMPVSEDFSVPLSWRQRWPLLQKTGGFTAGNGPAILTLALPGGRELRVAPSICFESLFPAHARAAVQLGAELLLNVANDAWFDSAAEREQQLAAAVFRAIETRRPLLRVGETGPTALILPDGTIAERLAANVPGALTVKIPLLGVAR